jgi:hypothetical protein
LCWRVIARCPKGNSVPNALCIYLSCPDQTWPQVIVLLSGIRQNPAFSALSSPPRRVISVTSSSLAIRVETRWPVALRIRKENNEEKHTPSRPPFRTRPFQPHPSPNTLAPPAPTPCCPTSGRLARRSLLFGFDPRTTTTSPQSLPPLCAG